MQISLMGDVARERYAHLLRTFDYEDLRRHVPDLAVMALAGQQFAADQLRLARAEMQTRPEAAAEDRRRAEWTLAAERQRTARPVLAGPRRPDFPHRSMEVPS